MKNLQAMLAGEIEAKGRVCMERYGFDKTGAGLLAPAQDLEDRIRERFQQITNDR